MRFTNFVFLLLLISTTFGQPSEIPFKPNASSPVAAAFTSSNICFTTFTNYPVTSPGYLVSGDFNADGNKDIVVSSAGIDVFLGTGTGSFGLAVHYPPIGAGDGRIITGDFNNDGKLDVATCSAVGNSIELYRGTGTGSFLTALNYNTAASAVDLATADFNNDGNLDVVVTLNGTINGYGVFLGNGLGGMTPFISYSLLSFPVTVQCYDFNSDGNKDLAMLSGNKLLIINGNGNGTFSGVPVNYSTTVSDIEFTMNDFNGDSFMDIAAASGAISPGYMDLYYGNAMGTFSTTLNWFSCGGKNESIVSADFNGDGNFDLACGRYGNPGQVSLVPGIGNGSFIYPIITYTIGDVTNDVIADDFNNDGKQDIATVNKGWNSISVMLNATPHLSVTSTSSICPGNNATLTVTGATSYTWNTSANSSSITVSPTVSTTYSVVGAIGSCTNNAAVTVSVQVCTGVGEINELGREVNLFPNPFNDYFEVSVGQTNSYEVLNCEIYDPLMKLVFTSELFSGMIKIDSKNIKSGVYFLRINIKDGHSKFYKIIKQN